MSLADNRIGLEFKIAELKTVLATRVHKSESGVAVKVQFKKGARLFSFVRLSAPSLSVVCVPSASAPMQLTKDRCTAMPMLEFATHVEVRGDFS